jgi:hypothetical protein
MSEREDFLARWSRRKRERIEKAAADEVEGAPVATAPQASETMADRDKGGPPLEPSRPLFDPTTLPSIDSIAADTDIRAFLGPGVPTELMRAALRRAWAADPNIRDFIGLADYAWDFHAPGAMAGFGPLEMTEELRREVIGMLTRGQPQELAGKPASELPVGARPGPGLSGQAVLAVEPALPQDTAVDDKDTMLAQRDPVLRSTENIAPQNRPAKTSQSIAQRSHGGALPKS